MEIVNPISNITQILYREHGDLQGLTDDDHTQYVPVDGSRPAKNIKSGADASKPATPAVGDVYIATDTSKLYVCHSAGSWEEYPAIILNSKGTQGDIIYHNGSKWTKLGAGTSGQFLKTQGAGANPVWADAGIKIAEVELGSNAQTIDLQNIPVADDYLAVLFFKRPSDGYGSYGPRMYLNNDSGNNYAYGYNTNYGSFTTGTSSSRIVLSNGVDEGSTGIYYMYIHNLSGQYKLIRWTGSININGASTNPSILNGAANWATTTGQINRITIECGIAANVIGAGSYLRVFRLD